MFSLFRIKPKKYNLFANTLQVLFFLFALVIIAQLMRLQIIDSHTLKEKAKQQRQAKAFTFRGEIADRNGVTLASDVTVYDIYAHPHYYFEQTPMQIATLLEPHIGQSKEQLFEKLNRLDDSTILLAKNVERTKGLKIKNLKLRCISLYKKNDRVYPQGNLASHILGYINPEADISTGVERSGRKNLESTPDINPIEYTGKGDVIYDFNTDPAYTTSPLTGQKLTLTIDSSIQHVAESELAKMMQKTRAERGTVIVMNPKNGEILSFAVLPSYDPNNYLKAKFSVVKNWVLSDVYPPGSTFKILTVASALETESISKHERILDEGKIKISGWDIRNYDYGKHPFPGSIDLKYLFEHSSNVGSLKVALKTPVYKHYEMLKKFGIGQKTGIDLPGESAGILPGPETWDQVRHATIGFGYSIASTPMQIAAAVASIANDGVWVTPHVIKYNPEEYEKRIKTRRVMSPKHARDLTEILASSIQSSESKAGKIPNYTVSGKTGTSRKPNPNGSGYLANQLFTSLVGYFPSKNPQVLIMVVVDNPKGVEIWGSTVAGPIFNAVATESARILNIPPDAPGLNTK